MNAHSNQNLPNYCKIPDISLRYLNDNLKELSIFSLIENLLQGA